MQSIPIYRPTLSGNEKKYVNECLDSTWISGKGDFLERFEKEFATYTGSKHALTVCNGTVALHLALVALGVGLGDEVIVPTLTYIAPVNAIAYTGANPIFVDSLKSTWQMDPDDIEKKITSKTKAILVIHLYGHPCEMDRITSIARNNNIFLIEDCAEAFGTYYKNKHVGTFGDIATYSFFGNKTITTGEGGMVVTDDETLHERSLHFKGQGLAKHREYWHDVIGFNYRMTNICAAIGLAQLEKAEEFLHKKRSIALYYEHKLQNLPVLFHSESESVRHSFWMCSIVVQEASNRDLLREHLSKARIETRPVFYPVHTMPMYSQKYQRLPVAENLGWCGINLPSWPGLSDKQLCFICDQIEKFFVNLK